MEASPDTEIDGFVWIRLGSRKKVGSRDRVLVLGK